MHINGHWRHLIGTVHQLKEGLFFSAECTFGIAGWMLHFQPTFSCLMWVKIKFSIIEKPRKAIIFFQRVSTIISCGTPFGKKLIALDKCLEDSLTVFHYVNLWAFCHRLGDIFAVTKMCYKWNQMNQLSFADRNCLMRNGNGTCVKHVWKAAYMEIKGYHIVKNCNIRRVKWKICQINRILKGLHLSHVHHLAASLSQFL